MNTHRLLFCFTVSLLIISLTSSLECDENSSQDGVPFKTRVYQSPLVVIGVSFNKNIDLNIRNLFNVTLLVQCILKGQPTERFIRIVQAGTLLGRHSCQRLDVNRKYIVFLEPFFDGTYRPADFQEILYDDQTEVLLGRTCGLSRTYPLIESNDTKSMVTNKCPAAASINCSSETTTNSVTFGTSTVDFALLSLLLAQEQQGNHEQLFSDDDLRKNQANRCSSLGILLFIQLIFYKRIFL